MKLSIVIVNWNTADLLAQCIESVIRSQTDLNSDLRLLTTEIFVVDNNSDDGSPQMLRERFPQVRLTENRTNVGFARANNQAIVETCGQYILLLNPDTEVKPGALEMLVRFLEDHPEVGAVGPRLLNPDGSLQPSCHPTPTLARELWRLFHLDTFRPYALYPMAQWDMDNPRAVDMLQGACLLLRRTALDQVGLLDENYFIYSEEVDLCYRLGQAGWLLYWLPEARVVHYGGQSTQQVAAEMFLQLYQGKLLYFRKHRGLLAAQLFKLILLVAALARLLVSPLAWLERSPRRQQHLTLARNYGRLIRALPGF